MKIGYISIFLWVLLHLSCASNKSVNSTPDAADDSKITKSASASENSDNTEESTPDMDAATEDVLSEAEQQAIFLEAQKLQAEKDATEERQRLMDLRESLAKLEEEAQEEPKEEVSTSEQSPIPPTTNTKVIDTMPSVPAEGFKEEPDVSGVGATDDYYSEGDIVIQFFASIYGDKNFDQLSKFGKIIVEQVPENSLYRYNIGYFRNRIEAEIVLEEVRGIGWTDAFVREK